MLTFIDLYSGIGGWTLGLELAGLKGMGSFEKWPLAAQTYELNYSSPVSLIDIRSLDLNTLPKGVDVVVGSPPCTQFSYSNRGGAGNLQEGLRDITRFLDIVAHIKPRYWVMENVPRAARIVEEELKKGGALARYKELGIRSCTLDLQNYGVPQRRRRSFIGNLDFESLTKMGDPSSSPTLGDIVACLHSHSPKTDPIFQWDLTGSIIPSDLVDAPLSGEEARINRSLKEVHPVYNRMSFPDNLHQPARTLTATCTRVSRESIVIKDPLKGLYRRLTAQERAAVQTFPINFQFGAASYAQRAKLLGNAFPPLMAFTIGCLLSGRPDLLADRNEYFVSNPWRPPVKAVAQAKSVCSKVRHREGIYKADRPFRFAIPTLHFKSGVRFELTNMFQPRPRWGVRFYFGSPRDQRELVLTSSLLIDLDKVMSSRLRNELAELAGRVEKINIAKLQSVWCHHRAEGTHPFELLDMLDLSAKKLVGTMNSCNQEDVSAVLDRVLSQQFKQTSCTLPTYSKLKRMNASVIAGIALGCVVNSRLQPKDEAVVPREFMALSSHLRYA